MASRIRTLNFLPEVFQTPTNAQFLGATLDQIVDQPNTMRIEGYVGSKFGYGINAKDKYVIEPTKARTDYQLDPAVVFTKTNTATAVDFISYPGMVDAVKLNGGITDNNDRLFNSQFYSWDPFVDLDKVINFNQYYWLPTGAPAVTIATDVIYNTSDYTVTSLPNGYNIASDINPSGSINPSLTLIRGGTYTFTVNQTSQFWIQGKPGITGYDPSQPNIQTRDILGVDNNGATTGVVTFNVPYKTAQDEYNFPGNNLVDVVSSIPFDQIDGQLLSYVKNIDGVTSLDGRTVMFYNTGVVNETGFVGPFYDTTLFDENGGNPFVSPGTSLDDTNYEGGYYTDPSATFYKITYVGSIADPVLKLTPFIPIPTNEKITVVYGTEWKARDFYRNVEGAINLIPYLSSLLDTIYYQDGTSPDKVGVIKLINSNITNEINVNDILGKATYTAPNGVVFTNGLKVSFSGSIYPDSYKSGEYYVQGVGTAIELLDAATLIAPEPFTSGTYTPYDTLPYDIGNYDSTLYIPVYQDYLTISRNSIDKNAWSRSNRWFHIDVINATANYLNDPTIATTYATKNNKASRPIIEFYPNLKLFNNCVVGKQPVDFFDDRTTDAFTQVAGQLNYYPDVEVYTASTASIASATATTSTTVTVLASDIGSGTFQVGQYITDSDGKLPNNTQITNITGTTTLTLTVSWPYSASFTSVTNVSLVANDLSNDDYALYDGAKIIFSADTNIDVRNKIYIVRFSSIAGATPVITLTEVENGLVLPDEGTFAFKGYYNQGKDFHFDGLAWFESQQKTTINQAPLFDIYDTNGISFGDSSVYVGTSFKGNKLFSYGIGSGINDLVLGFPLRYSSVNNVGDISFDVPLNSSTFNYVQGTIPVTQKVNTGYVYNYSDLTTHSRSLGWQTAVAESRQYQVFSFDYVATNPVTTYTCDIAASTNTVWPNIQVYVNNDLQAPTTYTYEITDNSTVITFTPANTLVDTVIEVAILSDQVSTTAYYEIPINLENNPFNNDITTANVGDIRGQYQSIFYNNPNTTGSVFGSNNYRDLGNLVPWGNKIIQNSASLALPGTFLRKQNHNLIDSLQYNSQQYIIFKSLLVATVDSTDYNVYQLPATMLDDALTQITSSKIESGPFFWSDMLPNQSAYVTNTYTFANSLDISRYPLTTIYDFTKSNYKGVLVYLTTKVNNFTSTSQLIINVDYTVSVDSPSLTITKDLNPGDVVTIKEYTQTYGSYVPNTPTKMGLYPSFIPAVILDSNYTQPTYFIRGHDGSYNQLYGDYIDSHLVDFRDQVLLEFETRIYNNLKLSDIIPIRDYDVIPGFFRNTGYSYEEILSIYSQNFLNWVGQNRVEYKPQLGYSAVDQFSYNYGQSGNKIDSSQILQGYWRGIYQYFYDTSQPDVTPWEMIGFTIMPSWWTSRYGPAPYTSDNLILWEDLAQGINWNNGNPVVIPEFVRPQLLEVIPVDSAGNLLSPFDAIVGNYDQHSFRHDWKVGDVAATEFSYRRSSSWPFDLMKLLSLTKPADFYNLGVDVDNYKYNSEFNQFLVNDRDHLIISDVQIYGNGIAKASYINWIVDYEKQLGIDATTNITDLLDNLDVRLAYRLAGFSDKTLLNFYVEKGTPNSTNASLLIPAESYDVLLYDNVPFDKIIYSGVLVQKTFNGWKVFGNSQNTAYFNTSTPKINGNYNTVTVEKISVQVAKDYFDERVTLVPYGTEFYSAQELAQFLGNYSNYLITQGIVFDQIESGLDINWRQMVAEYLYWIQSGWEVGSLINLNPAANIISINKDSYVVQPLTLQKQNFVLNQNLYPIQSSDLAVVRDSTLFTATPLNQGDTVAYGQFNISNFEHGIVFNNVTLFNDVIYNLTTGLRQNRITLRGTKTADWNGTIDAQGFILNQDNILEWNNITKYTKGSIVLYKNRYWTALKVIDASTIFDPKLWKETDYNEIQKGLLPNGSTRSYESTLFYDTNRSNLDRDSDLLGWSLIGYRPRDYLALADLTDITQVNVYKNMIKQMGTRIAASNFKGLNLPQGGIDYDIYDNWAIKTGEFGGVLDNNFVEFRLNQSALAGNPSTVALTTGDYTDGVEQEVPLYSVFNYGRPITNPNVLATLPVDTPNKLYSDAGYVNFNDVTAYGYYYNDLNTAQTPLEKLYVGEYVWVADLYGTWQIYTPIANGQLIQVVNNLNGTATLVFAEPHNLTKYQTIAIINFDSNVNGYRIVQSIVDNYRVTIALSLVPAVTKLNGVGTVMRFQSQRVDQPSDINSLPLLNTEFVKNKVWVDTNTDGDWAVYRKSINYAFDLELLKDGSQKFGSAVATTNDLGYLVGDSGLGVVYRYVYNPVFKIFVLTQTLTGSASFGSAISYSGSTFAVSQPTGTLLADRLIKVYSLITTITQNTMQLLQTIQAPTGVTNWGSATAFSGDGNWLYISAYEQNSLYVYRKSQVTGLYEYSTIVTLLGQQAGDNFSYALSTNYYGDTVIIGAPGVDTIVNNTGNAYIFERLVQNFESQYNSQPYVPQTFNLAYTPGTTVRTASNITSSAITLDSVAGLAAGSNGTAIVFTGTVFGGIALNQVYYVKTIVGSTITLSLTRGGAAITFTNSSGTMSAVAQTQPLFVSVNGTLITDNTYSVIGTTLNVYQSLTAGDIVNVSSSQFVLIESLQAPGTVTIGEQYGYSLDTNTYGTEILVGSPFQVNTQNQEGAVYRYTDGGGKYGIITGLIDCQVTTATTILLNGYAVAIPVGNATVVANAITSAKITNVTATTLNNKLVISTINNDLANINDKLNLVTLSGNDMYQLGISKYQLTQTINDPHSQGRTQFGTTVKFNEGGSFVVSAPVAARYEETTFDASDDDNYNNDTLFDNNTTQFIDTYTNAGAVYMFDYVSNYNENLNNVGQFIYAQNINAFDLDYGSQPYYGTALDFNNNQVIVGTPNFRPNVNNGQVIIYQNNTGVQDWSVYRNSSPIVDVNAIQNAQLYSASTNNTLINLDYIDPLQGKLLGAVAENIDITSNRDPAAYNSPNATNTGSIVWGVKQVGQLWFDTSTTKFVNYHQSNDVVYNSKWWGKVFPGSSPAVYSWVASEVIPTNYNGPGTPKDLDNYAIEYTLNTTGAIVPVYFYWVRNTNIVFTKLGKTLSDTICQSYITAPLSTGIAYFAPLLPNAFGLYNTTEYVNNNDTVMHIGFATGTNDDVSHSAYTLIRENYPDDFLPGLPGTFGVTRPESLYNRMLESMSGVDLSGAVVPDPNLPKAVQSGILVRPRQSFFYNRFGALKNYLTTANEVLAQYPFNETGYSTFLHTVGAVNPSTGLPSYETSDYWTNINWWATGYNDNTRAAMMVQSYYDLATLNAQNGLIVTVAKNGQGLQETYKYDSTLSKWIRIGLQNGTIQFKSSLWDYPAARLGWGDNFFDTTPFDTYPSEETRYIIRALNEEMPSELNYFRNKGLILLFNYIMSETIESQNYLPWLNKTSFIDVTHNIRELLPLQVYQSDNQDFLSGYVNEVKPYHVVIKDFLFKYTGTDIWQGNVTDFDLPATYNTNLQKYITPELVYSNPSQENQYLPTDPIWQTAPYLEWFNNHGLSITGVNDYPITTLASYLTLSSKSMIVDNVYGFPINGVIQIGQEQIAYSGVDRAYGILSGLTRGVNGTPIETHIPGEQIITDLPAVLLLNGGRGYAEPPKVTAYIDTALFPAPTRAAILQPVMNLDTILRIDVIDPGEGYAVLPEILIEPSATIAFPNVNVDLSNNTVIIQSQVIQTGDLVRYTVGANTTPIGGLKVGEYYYVSVLETIPNFVISFYTSYVDALKDHDRVDLLNGGAGSNNYISISAKASCVSTAIPIRENQITMRFDRTSYTSQIQEWTPGNYYGSFYAGLFRNTTQVASSRLTLESSIPPINNILASAQGAPFYLQDISNNQVIDWSSRTRIVTGTNSSGYVTISPSDGGAPLSALIGPTTGFYIGMPIKFTGASFGGLIEQTVYYISAINGLTQFKLVDSNSNPVVLTTASAPAAGLTAIIGEVTNTAVVTIDYPGILPVTATQAVTNFVTTPLLPGNQGGTAGFYQGVPLFFTGTVFGNVVQNDTYYVTTVVNDTTFTMSTTNTPAIMTATQVYGTGDYVKLSSVAALVINDPVIFTDMYIAGSSVSNFGGIIAGQVYYVASIDYSTNRITISNTVNGGNVNLSDVAAADDTYCTMTDQIDTVTLTTATGNMTMNVGLPISPGQITGQKFTFYKTSGSYTNGGAGYTGTVSNLISVDTVATVATSNYLYVSELSGGITHMYVNMPFRVASAVGGLSAGTTYYVKSIGSISVEITNSSSSTNLYTADNTTGFYVGMPIVFTGGIFGNVEPLVTYYIKTLPDSTHFSVSEYLGGPTVVLSQYNGSMTCSSINPYITLSTSPGGATSSLTTSTTSTTLTQYITSAPTFYVSYKLGGYSVTTHTAGSGFAYNNNITISGTNFGGTSPLNDVTINIANISSTGAITATIISGTPYELSAQYYLKVISDTQLEVYQNELMTVPVDGTVLEAEYTAGDYVFLPEPFFFTQSMVKYNHRVWQCTVSNNDTDFILGKWTLMDSGDRRLNELDRIMGYYQPTVNMPGLDLTQLVSGIVYPNNTYLDNAFPPADEYPLDTVLSDQSFYPTSIDNIAITWDGTAYVGAANSPTYSSTILSTDASSWSIDKIANSPVSVTDIVYADEKYVITTTNAATPIYVSLDGITYTTTGGSNVHVESKSLNSVDYFDGTWVAVGENIVTSVDSLNWVETYPLPNSGTLRSVHYVNNTGFNGWLTVGNWITNNTNTSVILSSSDGFTWSQVNQGTTTIISSATLNVVYSGNDLIIFAGANGQLFTSTSPASYTQQTTGVSYGLNGVIYSNGLFVVVGDHGTIITSTNAVTWTTRTSNTTNNLNGIIYDITNGKFVIVGDNNTILSSVNGTTWTPSSVYTVDPTVYTVQGDAFTAGYGPEELVPGVVTDNLTMIVNTRPGTNWNVGQYGHTGFNVVSTQITPSTLTQVDYSFLNIVQNPATIAVYDLDTTTGLSVRTFDFTIDWVNKIITLNNHLAADHQLVIDLYEVGNGDQLEKSNSQVVPFIDNLVTGFTEIPLNCNYSANRFTGSGVIRPGTGPKEVLCTSTRALDNSILCANVNDFVLNQAITFQGDVLGGLSLDTYYYVKTISYITKRITVSATTVDDLAGPTFVLTDDSGNMEAIIAAASDIAWTDPIVIHNGDILNFGHQTIVTQTKSSTNSIVCNTTGGFYPGDIVTFSDEINSFLYDTGLTAQYQYTILSIVDDNDFTVEDPANPGNALVLNDSTGIATCIVGDYAFAPVDNSTIAKMIFAYNYDQETDFVQFTVFGETQPQQYGYSVPLTQLYTATGGESQLALENYVGGDTANNAVVEKNGLRLVNISDYTISEATNNIYLNSSLVAGDILAITTFNLTDRQYLNTTYGGTFAGSASRTLTVTATRHESAFDEFVSAGQFIVGVTYMIESIGTTDFTLIGASSNTVGVIFTATGSGTGNGVAGVGYGNIFSPSPDYLTLGTGDTSQLVSNLAIVFSAPTFGGIVANKYYYISEIINGTTFNLSETIGGPVFSLITGSGSMTGYINPAIVANITNINSIITPPTQITTCTQTYSGTNVIDCNNIPLDAAGLNVIFKGTSFGDILTDGTVYIVDSVISATSFTIKDQYGTAVSLTSATGTIVAYIGGTPAVTVYTGIPHGLLENDLVRIDGTTGSTQLNNNTYYAKVINTTSFQLYQAPYNPALNAVNNPVLNINAYTGGGYAWLDKTFTLTVTSGTSTSATGNKITVNDTTSLELNTPVYFSGTLTGTNLVAGTKYYIKAITSTVEFTVSSTYEGSEFVLGNATVNFGVSQWEQTDVSRLWVSVNGYRIPSSSLYINPNNNLSILHVINPGDAVIITNMIPTATPNELTYILNVTRTGAPSVYRANSLTTTWLTRPLQYTDSIIYVEDVSKLTNTLVQIDTVPALVNNVATIGLDADKRTIAQVIVKNGNTTLPSSDYYITVVDTAPVLKITSGVAEGDTITITLILGNIIYLAGEQIRFTTIDFDNNTITGLQRGANGTGERDFIPVYQKVYSALSQDRLSETYYNQTWNSYVYNPVLGDPLQISNTYGANFLNADYA
jgi:hypothetical protein